MWRMPRIRNSGSGCRSVSMMLLARSVADPAKTMTKKTAGMAGSSPLIPPGNITPMRIADGTTKGMKADNRRLSCLDVIVPAHLCMPGTPTDSDKTPWPSYFCQPYGDSARRTDSRRWGLDLQAAQQPQLQRRCGRAESGVMLPVHQAVIRTSGPAPFQFTGPVVARLVVFL